MEEYKKGKSKRISVIIRNRLFLVFLAAFLLTMTALTAMQGILVSESAKQYLKLNVSDVRKDILDASDDNILTIAVEIAEIMENIEEYADNPVQQEIIREHNIFEDDPVLAFLLYLQQSYGLQNICVIDENGIISQSTNPDFLGFDMASGPQSAEFLCLLDGTESLVQPLQPITFDESIYSKYAGIKLERGGFLQISYDEEKFHSDLDHIVRNATKNRHIGETGYILIVSDEGTIISSPYDETIGHAVSEYGLNPEHIFQRANFEAYEEFINGATYSCIGDKVENYYIYAIIPKDELISSFNKTLGLTNILEVITFAIVFWQVYYLIKKLVSKNVEKVADSLELIAKGNFDVEVDVGGTEEFESLSRNINTTVNSLKEYARAEAEQFEKELEYAKNIQRSALPSLFPPYPDRKDFDIYATMDPAKEVGGDFFDFELLESRRLAFCVADVSGKGVPAALFMMRAKTLIKSYGVAGLHPDEILKSVNEELCKNNDAGMFVTCWLGILDTETGLVEYANAGHNPPLLKTSGGEFVFLNGEKPGFILAGMENIRYQRHEIRLTAGDEIFVYTDGVTEATNSENELFGNERLKDALDSFASANCTEKCILLRKSIDAFVGNAPQFDDITMLSLRYNGENI